MGSENGTLTEPPIGGTCIEEKYGKMMNRTNQWMEWVPQGTKQTQLRMEKFPKLAWYQ